MNTAGHDRKVAAARLWATSHVPYLASAIFASSVRMDPDCGTIAIDRSWQIRADPSVLETFTVPQLGRLLIHLCAHLVRDHATRARTLGVKDDDGSTHWNRAADAEINDDLAADELVPHCANDRPSDLGCVPHNLTEHYFSDGKRGRRRWDCGSGADGCDRPGDSTEGIDPRQGEWLRLKVAADIHSQPPGTDPGGWHRWAEALLPTRTDWRRALAAEVRRAVALTTGSVDYSYHRPSRRAHLCDELVLPTLVRPVPEVAIVCDTSGSMHDGLLARALAEINGILSRAGLRGGAPVLAVDTNVHTAKRVTSSRQVRLAGGGGTDMGRGIEAAAKLRPKPSIVIVLTDGFTPWPDRSPAGTRVIIGLLTQATVGMRMPLTPGWARTILIDE